MRSKNHKKRGYESLEIWQLGMRLVELTYSFKGRFPKEERYRLWGQLSGSVESFLQNLTEGYGKPSPRDFAHYVDNAIASILESETSYKIAVKKGYISEVDLKERVLPLTGEIFNKSRRFKTWILTRGGKFNHTTTIPHHHNTTAGFTLIELLLVVSILGIITGATIPIFTGYQKSQNLRQAAQQVKSDLRFAQSRALSSLRGQAWGLRFSLGSSSYAVLSCGPGDFSCSLPLSSSLVNLGSSVVINTGAVVVFDVLSGTVYVDGSRPAGNTDISVRSSDGSLSEVVRIGAGGEIKVVE